MQPSQKPTEQPKQLEQSPQSKTIEEKDLKALVEQMLANTERQRGEIVLTKRGIDFGNIEGVSRWAECLIQAGVTPKGLNKSGIIVAIIIGRTVGLDAFQAIQNIAVINGRPVMFGDLPLAVARQHPAWDESGFSEHFEGEGDDYKAVCLTRRKGQTEPRRSDFSVRDAKQAKLWGKDGPWTFYPKRMLMFRARGYNVRDNFGDALKGLGIKELENEEQPTAPALPTGSFSIGEPRRGNGLIPATPPSDESTPPIAENPISEPEAPADPEPAVDSPSEEEMQAADRARAAGEFSQRILNADGTDACDSLEEDLKHNKDFFGEKLFGDLLERVQARRASFTVKFQPGKKARQAALPLGS